MCDVVIFVVVGVVDVWCLLLWRLLLWWLFKSLSLLC